MKTNKRFLALCLALLLACAVLPAPTAQGADVQPVLSAALAQQAAHYLSAVHTATPFRQMPCESMRSPTISSSSLWACAPSL